jgi:hypothetical protein
MVKIVPEHQHLHGCASHSRLRLAPLAQLAPDANRATSERRSHNRRIPRIPLEDAISGGREFEPHKAHIYFLLFCLLFDDVFWAQVYYR